MSTKTSAERRERFLTSSGIELPVDFNPSNTDAPDYEHDLGAPGEYPYTRGIRRNMYRGRFWTMRQYAGFATAEESNERYKYLLSQGTTGLSVAFDLPTQIGLDSDDPLAAGEVGKVGVAIDTIEDMETCSRDSAGSGLDVDDDKCDGLDAAVSLSRRREEARHRVRQDQRDDSERHPQGIHRPRHLHLIRRNRFLRLITDTFAYCAREVPNWNTISIRGYHIREAGSTAAQEIAFTLADGICYVRRRSTSGSKLMTLRRGSHSSSIRTTICWKR